MIALLRNHWPLLFYGWLLSFASGFGQTYFVSIFGGSVRSDFALDHGAYGLSYSTGTLVSAVLLLWFGRLIDRVSLRVYSLAAVIGLALGTLAMSLAQGIVGLTIVFFLLRFFGQGLMSHAAITTMARQFSAERGRAVAFSVTGHVAGGVVLPLIGAGLLGLVHWRDIWSLASLFLALLVVPLVIYLLSSRRPGSRASDAILSTDASPSIAAKPSSEAGMAAQLLPPARLRQPDQHWTASEALGDPRLYIFLAVLLMPSFVTTGFIFHLVSIGTQKGWGLDVIASALSVFALASFATTLLAGRQIDRHSAQVLIPFALGPLIVACIVLTQATSVASSYVFFVLLGFGSGTTTVLMGVIWAEVYGTRHLGAIRSIAASGSVFASALAPGLFGLMLDWQWSVSSIALLCAGFGLLASVVAGAAKKA